jgi:hypothetical protein
MSSDDELALTEAVFAYALKDATVEQLLFCFDWQN